MSIRLNGGTNINIMEYNYMKVSCNNYSHRIYLNRFGKSIYTSLDSLPVMSCYRLSKLLSGYERMFTYVVESGNDYYIINLTLLAYTSYQEGYLKFMFNDGGSCRIPCKKGRIVENALEISSVICKEYQSDDIFLKVIGRDIFIPFKDFSMLFEGSHILLNDGSSIEAKGISSIIIGDVSVDFRLDYLRLVSALETNNGTIYFNNCSVRLIRKPKGFYLVGNGNRFLVEDCNSIRGSYFGVEYDGFDGEVVVGLEA